MLQKEYCHPNKWVFSILIFLKCLKAKGIQNQVCDSMLMKCHILTIHVGSSRGNQKLTAQAKFITCSTCELQVQITKWINLTKYFFKLKIIKSSDDIQGVNDNGFDYFPDPPFSESDEGFRGSVLFY